MSPSRACRFQRREPSGMESPMPALDGRSSKRTLPMKTPRAITSPFTVPVALLMMSLALSAPTAHADSPVGLKTFQVRFVFNPADSAQKIYADLDRVARRA